MNHSLRFLSKARLLAVSGLALWICPSAGHAANKFPVYDPQAKEPEERVREGLDFIAKKMRPEEGVVENKIKTMYSSKSPTLGVQRWAARWDKSPQWAMAALSTGQNIDAANAALLRWLRDYAAFGTKEELLTSGETDPSKIFRIRLLPASSKHLSEAVKDEIEIAAYEWVKYFSNVDPNASSKHNASKGQWHMTGSENHDATDKRATILGLQILARDGKKYNARTKLPDGRTVEEHYDAWKAYWKENIRQRAREGLFCEIAQPSSYGKATNGCYLDLYDLSDDPELKRLANQMLCLHFAQLAGEFEPRTGIRAAIATTRAKDAGTQMLGSHWTKTLTFVWGWGDAHEDQLLHGESANLTTTWRPPAIITAIALDPRTTPYFSNMRNFGLGEAKDEKTNVNFIEFADGDQRNSYVVRRSWITPDYAVSGITVDPSRNYLAAVSQSRLAGIAFPTGSSDRFSVLGDDDGHPAFQDVNAVAGKDCLVAGREPDATSKETKIFCSNTLWSSRREDPSGWQFFQAGNGFCAVRIAGGGYDAGSAPHKAGMLLTLKDKDSPVVLQAGRATDYPGGFEQFMEAVLKKTQFAFNDYCLEYVSLAGDRYKFWTKEKQIPEFNGAPLDLNPKETYSSPYLTMVHGTDKAVIKYPGHDDLVLDFSPRM